MRAIACAGGKILLFQTSFSRCTSLDIIARALRTVFHAIRGGLTKNLDQAQFERNRLRRCDNQPPQDREDCIRRMNGEGTTSGSVQSGGIYRELVTPVDPAKGQLKKGN